MIDDEDPVINQYTGIAFVHVRYGGKCCSFSRAHRKIDGEFEYGEVAAVILRTGRRKSAYYHLKCLQEMLDLAKLVKELEEVK